MIHKYFSIKESGDAGMPGSSRWEEDVRNEVQEQDLKDMSFRPDIQPEITEWISKISRPNWGVRGVQKKILWKFIAFVPEFRELLDNAFVDSESLNIPCTLDNNYLCTIISCTPRNYYKRIVVVWPGGRQEVWELVLEKHPRSGDNYILSFVCSGEQLASSRQAVISEGKTIVGTKLDEMDTQKLLCRMRDILE